MRPHLATLVDDLRSNGTQRAIVTYAGNRHTSTTYAQLARSSEQFAAYLHSRGIANGERVVLWAQNSAEWIAAFFGCMLRGVIVVPLDAAGTPGFAQRVIAETRPRLIVGDSELMGSIEIDIPTLILSDLTQQLSPLSPIAAESLNRDTPLQILFTSGTTGEPKGIVHTHGNVLASLEPIEREMQKYLRYERPFHPLRFLHTLPLSHVFGQFMGLWLPPLLAAEVHFESRFQAAQLVETIHRRRISVFIAVPRMLDLLRTHLLSLYPSLAQDIPAAQHERIWRRWWRFRRIHRLFGWKFWACVCGGATLPPELEQFWSTLGFALIQGYGMTETTALITLNHPFKIGKGTIGKPLPDRQIRIADDGEISVRGEMVATSIWQKGTMKQLTDPWLATGDIVSIDDAGQLHFLGRKSEVIVTPSGLNLHPEDVEAALTRQPEISACAVIPLARRDGTQEAVAILVAPAGAEAAARAVVDANKELADYQRILNWRLWPGSDLPRTSTGKVQRRKVAEWANQEENQSVIHRNDPSAQATEPLLSLIASVAGKLPQKTDDSARLQEDFHLDSLARLQLQSEIEQCFGLALDDNAFMNIETLGQLRTAVGSRPREEPLPAPPQHASGISTPASATSLPSPLIFRPSEFSYPHWPWWPPVATMRILFVEIIVRPLVWLLARPKVSTSSKSDLPASPMLLIANHVTAFDAALILYGLPSHIRRHVSIAAAGEMLEDWRHGRHQPTWWRNLLAPMQYWLLTALFNVFPLPRLAGFRRSFSHIGEALDHGYHVLIFPEGHRSADGTLQPFRSGIGLLAHESNALVLPIALKGLGNPTRRRWFHSGLVEIRLGDPQPIPSTQTPEQVTNRLHEIMQTLLN
jgi:long-chain acyl-CoA synthetase